MSQTRKIRDPVHGFIEINGRECDLVDMPLFQRLRGIRQLAMAYLVYPGALHTRFDHSLGVLYVAGRLCQKLEIDPDHTRIVRLSALLHDIGHGPFSHVSEDIINSLPTAEISPGEKAHEVITRKIILEQKDFAILGSKDREEIAELLHKGHEERIHRDILVGPLDADKQDYLLRDSYFCGVRYGVYDIDQLHNTLRSESDGEETILMIDPDGVHALEQFVLAKYYLTTQVYRHKVRLITDKMLMRAIQLGINEDRLPFLEKLYRYEPSREYISNYLEWNDQKLTIELLKPEHEATYAGGIFRRLRDRRLFKRIFKQSLAALPSPIPVALPEKFSKLQGELEQVIAEELQKIQGVSIDPHYVILNLFSIESVRTYSLNSEGAIMVCKRPQPAFFEEESTLFRSIDVGMKEEFLECYAPVSYEGQTQKRELLNRMQESVINLIGKKLSPASRPWKNSEMSCRTMLSNRLRKIRWP